MIPNPIPGAAADEPRELLLDLIAASSAAVPGRRPGVTVGECVADRHPQLPGRALIRVVDAGASNEQWMACLVHSVVRCGDRVLLLHPGNWPEPVVIGVLDGLAQRSAPLTTAAAIDLRRDEQIEIRDHTGTPLVTIVPTAAGPVLRLASADQRLEIAGRLVIAAEAVELRAREGMTIAAGGDVVVSGEEIKLN